jgi:hypothetical protein
MIIKLFLDFLKKRQEQKIIQELKEKYNFF